MKIDKSWYIKPKDVNFPISISAGGVVVRKDNTKILIALLKTENYRKYSLPKGTNENGESVRQTATREVMEETGLANLKMVCKLGIKERLSIEKTYWKISHYFLFQTENVTGKQNLQQDEGNLKLKWFNFESLPPLFWPEQKELIEENREKIKLLLQSRI
jgi:8-oxo-dGTP diphosphatase